jgi:hypothetical protein
MDELGDEWSGGSLWDEPHALAVPPELMLAAPGPWDLPRPDRDSSPETVAGRAERRERDRAVDFLPPYARLPPEERFAEPLAHLLSMGFDRERTLAALSRVHGNLHRAIDVLAAEPPPAAVVANPDAAPAGPDGIVDLS